MKYMFGGRARLPLTITTMAGAGFSAAAQHSQSLEAWFCHVPGLHVVMPSGAFEMKGLLAAAIKDDNPTLVIANKVMLGVKGPVPEDLYELALGQAHIVRPGSDVTVVALGRMVSEALEAADKLAGEGISVEIVDPRSLVPFDDNTIVESVRRTGHAVVVHEAVEFGGFGGEIVSRIQSGAFDHLDAPIVRVGAPFAPVPFSPALEKAYVPDHDSIDRAIRQVLGLESC